MDNDRRWKLFNLDSLLAELDGPKFDVSSIDLYVASLSYKNFDFIERRLPFIVESVTYDLDIWRGLVAAAPPPKYWIQSNQEGVVVFPQTDHCGCLRSYRYRGNFPGVKGMSSVWVTVADSQNFYGALNTPETRGVYDAWSQWMAVCTREATDLADGPYKNTTVTRSLILSGLGSCLACSAPAIASARTTIACSKRSMSPTFKALT